MMLDGEMRRDVGAGAIMRMKVRVNGSEESSTEYRLEHCEDESVGVSVYSNREPAGYMHRGELRLSVDFYLPDLRSDRTECFLEVVMLSADLVRECERT